ncbi:MAG: hypothetical protein AB9873_13115 [Syntrophobacteraceae bacterium]
MADLEEIPDLHSHFESWLHQLSQEGMNYLDVTGIRIAATRFFRCQLIRTTATDQEAALIDECDEWLEQTPLPSQLLPFLEAAYAHLKDRHPAIRRNELLAPFILRAIQKCVDQT